MNHCFGAVNKITAIHPCCFHFFQFCFNSRFWFFTNPSYIHTKYLAGKVGNHGCIDNRVFLRIVSHQNKPVFRVCFQYPGNAHEFCAMVILARFKHLAESFHLVQQVNTFGQFMFC